jgi:hypothetical protein
VAVGLCVGARAAQAAPDPFVFRIPDGWTDLSSQAPAENFEGVQDELVREAMKAQYAVFAIGPAAPAGGIPSTFNAILSPRTARVTPAFLDAMMEEAAARLSAAGWSLTVHEKQVLTVGGANVGRVVSDLTTAGGLTLRQVQYVMPGLEKAAVLTYSSAPEDFEGLRPVFEASALATQGVREPSLSAQLLHTDRGHYLLGFGAGLALLGLVGVLAVVILVKRADRRGARGREEVA